MSQTFRNALARHNVRERFHLIRYVMGLKRSSLSLGPAFRKELGRAIGTPVPHNAYVVVDYQLACLEEALSDTFGGNRAIRPGEPRRRNLDSTGLPRSVIDIDLMVVFQHGIDSTRIALVEAKYEGAWDNKQLQNKADWLSKLFNPDMVWANCVTPSFVLLSKARPVRVDTSGWPHWMAPEGAPVWIEGFE